MTTIHIYIEVNEDDREIESRVEQIDKEMLPFEDYKKGDSNEIRSGYALMSKNVTFKRGDLFKPSDDKLNSSTADVTLIAENQKLNVHKHVLASNSVYFERMFAGSFKELQNQDKIQINMTSFSYKIMKSLIKCFYTSRLIITKFNVQDLLIGSNLFLCEDIQQACVDYLKTMIDSENCMNLKDFASSLRLNELYSLCMNFITNNFRHVGRSEGFMNSSFEEIMILIKDDNLFAKEDMIYDVFMKWVKYDIKARHLYSTKILWFIRLPLILNTYQGIISVKDYQCAKIDNVCSFRTEHRKPFRKGILLISHNPNNSTPEWFEASTNLWQTCPSEDCNCTNFKTVLNSPTHLATCVLLDNGNLVAVGGTLRGVALKCVYQFNPKFNTWYGLPPMNYQRVKPYVIQINSRLFVIGGCKKLSYKNAIEYIDLNELVWFPVSNKIGKRPNISGEYIYVACVNQLIYIIGMKRAGFYNPLTNRWYTIAPIPKIKFGSAICVLNNNIYVIGGQRNGVFYKSVLAYCTVTEMWVSVAAMNSPRSHAGVAVMNGEIYVFGGKTDDKNTSNTFEVYDYHTNTWTVSSALMDMGRSDIDAIVVEKNSFLYKKVFEDATNVIH